MVLAKVHSVAGLEIVHSLTTRNARCLRSSLGNRARLPGRLICRAEDKGDAAPKTTVDISLDKEVSKFARNAATTFAPRASGATQNPAYKGSTLYTIFEVQAWVALVIGGLLSFNILYPSDHPDIARLLGMWSIWMFTVPSLRARECTAAEKDALNLLFLAIPLLNVALPFVWKNFAFIFVADCVMMFGVFAWKGLLPGGFASKEME